MKEFFAMGGYGFYIWCSMGMVFALMILEPLMLRFQRISLTKRIRGQIRRQAARSNKDLPL